MGFLTNLFKLKKKEQTKNNVVFTPPEVKILYSLESALNDLLTENRYIAKSDYRKIIVDFSEVHKHFLTIRDGGILPEYCQKYLIDLKKNYFND